MKKIPKFKTETEERDSWANADSTDYVDWSKTRRVLLPNIKPSLKTISLRLPELMIDELKLIANKKDVPYQSLIKIFLSERLSKELNANLGRDRWMILIERCGIGKASFGESTGVLLFPESLNTFSRSASKSSNKRHAATPLQNDAYSNDAMQ